MQPNAEGIMCARLFRSLVDLAQRFRQNISGSTAITFGLTIIPILTAAGAALDFSRASSVRTSLQGALDSAVLAAAAAGPEGWSDAANKMFAANLKVHFGSVGTPQFSSQSQQYTGTVSASVPTATTATASEPDNSCILTLDKGQPASHLSLVLNGAPVVNLAGCSLRSNTSMNCNGHDGNLTKAIAAGTAGSCGHPQSNTPPVPDIYASMASNITPKCGTNRPGLTWTGGSLPPVSGSFIQVNTTGQTEYHVCGDLTVTGTGFLTGSSPSTDYVIVIENGKLNVANDANISTKRTAIVLTGNNNFASNIDFPTGNGKSATLTLSPPTGAANVWQGVALFQDPSLTKSIDNKWGPGANFNADGLVYLGNSNVVTDGNTASSNAKCSKFVTNTFTTNGKIELDFDQSVSACSAIGLKQWGGVVTHLIR